MKLLTIKRCNTTIKYVTSDENVQTLLKQAEWHDIKLVKQRKGVETFNFTDSMNDKFTMIIESVKLLEKIDIYSIESEVQFPILYAAE